MGYFPLQPGLLLSGLLHHTGSSYKDALWYCFALVTTIGFGDITAVTDLGRTMSVVLGIYGIIVVALITSIIVNFYGEIKKTRPGDEAGAENNSPE